MIRTFSDASTEDLFHGRATARTRRLPTDVRSAALRKLDFLNAAARIDDLASPPGNRLERLSGDRKEFWSIRVNDQWRIIFRWSDGWADDVALTDYH
jgi:proteic killer suppression protein